MAIRTDVYGVGIAKKRVKNIAPKPIVSAPPEFTNTEGTVPKSILIVGGPLDSATIPLVKADLIIGRSQSSAIVLEDDFVSFRHARIFPQGDKWFVEDLDSTNGTYVNGEKLIGIDEIFVGTQIKIGASQLTIMG
jgi:pSer/pThr/pTyr-binding forkhead associated (FHA) protein